MVPGKKWGLTLGRAYCVFCLSHFILMTADYWANVEPSFFGDYTANSTPPMSYQVTNIATVHLCFGHESDSGEYTLSLQGVFYIALQLSAA